MVKIYSFLLLLVVTAPCIAEQEWKSITDNSSIKFIASYDGVKFEGQFTRFSSTINFDPNKPSDNKLISSIDVTSVDTQSRDRDQALAEPDWFYFSKYPTAKFSSQTIKQLSDDQLEVQGVLYIREQQKEISFPMQWTEINNQRLAQASIALDRRDFNIGIGEWLQDDTIGYDVEVIFSITYELSN